MDTQVMVQGGLNLCDAHSNDSACLSLGPPPPILRAVLLGIMFGIVDIAAIVGNILVIISVAINPRLRTVTNCFVVSLASADLLVGILVLPLGIKVEIVGNWGLGTMLCDVWISFDVMLCTASILNLCCISLDRYFAITNPMVYVTKRSKRLALVMICVVWVASIIITCPPIFGWREEGRNELESQCFLTRDPGYIIYSSLGSFYIPLVIMIFVYARIFKVAHEREKRLRPYRRSFVNGQRRSANPSNDGTPQRTPTIHRDPPSYTHEATESESREDDMEDRLIETSLVVQGQDVAIRSGKCVSVKELHEGLVISSALAMNEMVHAHHMSLSPAESSDNSSQPLQPLQYPRHYITDSRHTAHSNGTRQSSSRQYRSPSPRRRSAKTSRRSYPTSSDLTRSANFFSKREERRRERMVLMRERKTAKTLAVVVGCFVVCWLPFFLMYVIEPFCAGCDFHPVLKTCITWLGYCNSVINPFIYAFYNRDFRSSFWRLTCGLFCESDHLKKNNRVIYLSRL